VHSSAARRLLIKPLGAVLSFDAREARQNLGREVPWTALVAAYETRSVAQRWRVRVGR
jgi:hypothetical protein